MKKVRIGGLSNVTGFQIFDLTNGIGVKTKDYWETNFGKQFKLLSIISRIFRIPLPVSKLLFLVLSEVYDLKYWRWRRKYRYYQSGLEDRTNEWHSCEHKLIWLIENNKDVTLKTLKQAPDYDPKCGYGSKQISYLKEPSQEKLEETLKVGQEYYQKLSQLKNK